MRPFFCIHHATAPLTPPRGVPPRLPRHAQTLTSHLIEPHTTHPFHQAAGGLEHRLLLPSHTALSSQAAFVVVVVVACPPFAPYRFRVSERDASLLFAGGGLKRLPSAQQQQEPWHGNSTNSGG